MSAADGQPAPSNVAGREFPNVHNDSRVTFRVKAPDAQKAQVAPRGDDSGLGRGPYDMQRDSAGVWTVTTPPVRPGFDCNDPNSDTCFGWGQQVAFPEPSLNFALVVPYRKRSRALKTVLCHCPQV
jgi:hypothetical protein